MNKYRIFIILMIFTMIILLSACNENIESLEADSTSSNLQEEKDKINDLIEKQHKEINKKDNYYKEVEMTSGAKDAFKKLSEDYQQGGIDEATYCL